MHSKAQSFYLDGVIAVVFRVWVECGLVHLHVPLAVLLELLEELLPLHALLLGHTLKHFLNTCITKQNQ